MKNYEKLTQRVVDYSPISGPKNFWFMHRRRDCFFKTTGLKIGKIYMARLLYKPWTLTIMATIIYLLTPTPLTTQNKAWQDCWKLIFSLIVKIIMYLRVSWQRINGYTRPEGVFWSYRDIFSNSWLGLVRNLTRGS